MRRKMVVAVSRGRRGDVCGGKGLILVNDNDVDVDRVVCESDGVAEEEEGEGRGRIVYASPCTPYVCVCIYT